MSSSAKLAVVLFSALLATASAAEKTEDEKPKKPRNKETADKKSGKEAKEKPIAPDAARTSMQLPMPNGRDAKGLKIPYFDSEGKLQMRFDIGIATKLDDRYVQLSQMQVETFDSAGASEMIMDLPNSVLDLTTSVITAQEAVTIKRTDFELTGNTMTFNTKTKQGGLGGRVRMLIYDLESETADSPKTPENPAK